jgi:hypothetical protein
MTKQTVNAATAPGLANKLVSEALDTPEEQPKAEITAPLENIVELPGGFITPAGEVLRTAEVRELNGLDEEAVSRQPNFSKSMSTIISRAVVSIGDEKVTEQMLDSLLAADRDALFLGILKTTFGNTVVINGYCESCKESKEVEVDLSTDIKTKVLVDPIADRKFEVKGKKNTYTVVLASGKAQKALTENADKTLAELTTIMLEHCVTQINGSPVIGKHQIQNMPLVDRRKVGDELADRTPGPQFEDIEMDCPDCGGKVVVPINLGTLFRI